MSKTMKAVLAVIVIALLAAGAYYWYANGGQGVLTDENTNELPSGTDASDDGLSEDFAAIDAQMDAFISDGAYIDAGLNDQPVEQESL